MKYSFNIKKTFRRMLEKILNEFDTIVILIFNLHKTF